jgi:hypothetical protein
MRTFIILMLGMGFISSYTPARADTILDFQDVLGTVGSDVPFFGAISVSGFELTATNPGTGSPSGFEAHGPSSAFYAGEVGLVALPPATSPPDNVIELMDASSNPFTMVSIDLARNFAFDPAPTVTFTGVKNGGGTVTETFTVTTPVGVSAFQTFFFQDFTDVVSVSWGQPQLANGLHQFANIDVLPTSTATPEPTAWILSLTGLVGIVVTRMRTRSREAR